MVSFRVFYLVIAALMLPMFASCGKLGTAGTSGVTHVSEAVSRAGVALSAPGPGGAVAEAGGGLSAPARAAAVEVAGGTGAYTAISM